ncbi:F-box protein isoform X1 [Iris pallida]|uniref:F-box protein isoform X1 n=1 Tax=Iris pallida TaxID=29817 RepID=A0AAX6HGJ2_IRIPA|nr:F-box protein isoform X1 [Iris pallida]KAJ6839757.1 F-box protein isoform X1 [Iris pallida]
MESHWSHGEVLKVVFPILDGEDLCSCMSVCRQWRDTARDDYLWKRICSKRWPSICKKPPPSLSYYKLFVTVSAPRQPQPLLPAKLSFTDLDFYFDIWSDEKLIFSEAVSGSTLLTGIKNPPSGMSESLRAHFGSDDYKMMVQVEPRFTFPLIRNVSVSVIVCRKDTGQMACILNRSPFDYIDWNASKALAYDYLNFSPDHPFVSGIRAWVSLLSLSSNDDSTFDVFGIEVDFRDAAVSENEVLRLLDMLDWK